MSINVKAGQDAYIAANGYILKVNSYLSKDYNRDEQDENYSNPWSRHRE